MQRCVGGILYHRIKSIIRNFKDNRFNGLFEVSVQVFHHYKDYLKALEKSTHSTKQQRLVKALLNKDLILMLVCLGIFFSNSLAHFSVFQSPKHPFLSFKILLKIYTVPLKKKVEENPNFTKQFQFLETLNFKVISKEAKSSPT